MEGELIWGIVGKEVVGVGDKLDVEGEGGELKIILGWEFWGGGG